MELSFNQVSKNYQEIKINNNYNVRQSENYNALFKDESPVMVYPHDNTNIYNKIFDFKPRAKSIDIKNDYISIDFVIESKKFKDFDFKDFKVNIGYEGYDFSESDGIYNLKIPYDSIHIKGKSAGIFLVFEDNNGFTFKKKFLSTNGPHKPGNHDIYTSSIKSYDNHSIYIYETWRGYLTLSYREPNITDKPAQQIKIKLAFYKQKLDSKLKRNVPSILLYEKFCGKYEESAKVVFERLIDDGFENVFFILDKDSPYYEDIPEKYKPFIIDKYSFKHYYEYFNAKAFIASESFYHAIEVTNSNSLVRRRQHWENYHYFFLQHGVMYAYSLKGRSPFIKGLGFTDNSYIVISSETEGSHFIEQGKFDREDLIKSGLPKYDYAVQNKDADKILIMPTSRDFEYSTIRDDSENSTYYNFSKNIIESVPDELKDKIVFIPHPLVNNIIGKTDLEKYMSKETKYDKLLRDTKLLITDYSSISYDAFYRGCNVVFAWMEKEMCLEKLGVDLMLNDDNAFADRAYDYETLTELISKNYYGNHSKEYIRKYEDIVEFHDGRNTERFVEYIYSTNLFPEKAKKTNIHDAKVTGIENKAYIGKAVSQPNIKISYNGKKLLRNIDFTLKYINNKSIGTSTIEIIGKGVYSGKKSINFEIKQNIGKCNIEFNENGITVFDSGEALIEGKDYMCEILYDYDEIDLNKIHIVGISKYAGEKNILIDKKDLKN